MRKRFIKEFVNGLTALLRKKLSIESYTFKQHTST